jgi:hypothetical protein
MHVVLEEGCLYRTVGGPKVMANELLHLEELAQRPNITMQVAPFSMGEEVPFPLPVVLLDMPDQSMVGYAESTARGHVERSRTTLAAWSRAYDHLQVEALPTAASLAMIRKARKELQL